MEHTDNIFQTFVHFMQIIGSQVIFIKNNSLYFYNYCVLFQSRTLEYVSVIKALIKFLTNVCNNNWDIPKQK